MLYFQIGVILINLVLIGAIGTVLIDAYTQPARTPASMRATIGTILLTLATVIFIGSGISKFLRVPLAVTEMTLLGLTGYKYYLVAALEVTSGILMLVPPLRSAALLFVSAHIGGAICAHFIADQIFAMLPSLLVLNLCWLGAFLRHPEMLWSLRAKGAQLRPASARAFSSPA